MNIAILLYGQPRFFDKTQKYIKQFFNIKGVNFFYFAHFWDSIAYGPRQEKRNIYHNINYDINKLANDLKIKKLQITNFNILDRFLTELQEELNTNFFNKKRYQFGQHISVHESFNLMKQYEKEATIDFDLVLKIRTDFIFRKIKEDDKYNNIVKVNSQKNIIYVNDYEYKLVTNEKNLDIKEDIISKYPIEQLHIDFIPDTWFICDRTSSEHIFGDWKKYYISSYKKYNKSNKFFILKKPHNLISEICLINNIKLIKNTQKPILFYRLVDKNNCKSRFLKNKQYIKIQQKDLDFQYQIYTDEQEYNQKGNVGY